MAKNKGATEGAAAPARSESINLDENQGRNALAAWKMLFNLYGARVESWNRTAIGVEATGFSVFGQYDPSTVIADISSRTRRLDYLTVAPWVEGQAPEPYTDAAEITADTVQFYKGAVEEGSAKSPPYTKTAVSAFKAAHSLAKKRGPKPRVIHLDDIENIDPATLENMDGGSIAKLQALLERAAASKAAAPQGEAVTA